MRTALLVRHAETEWSIARRHTGRTDLPLSPQGREQAAALAPVVAGEELSLVLCSPLTRARETVALSGLDALPGAVMELRDDLMEWDYGDYEGITTREVREQRPDWELWRHGAPGGESPADVGARVDRVIAELLEAPGDVAVVAHGHLLRALAARWLGQPVSFGRHLALSTASVSRLGFERDGRALRAWNHTTTSRDD